jgi:hypothetical protein
VLGPGFGTLVSMLVLNFTQLLEVFETITTFSYEEVKVIQLVK